ncbi:hypothetical protein K502DRAFT_331841 [Neoconidiobolus thromboides FSU 785]|nr:hypothetical protein K502DRAFT_331841 [Neoconidiobolus thromboides FSU 785]
MYNNHLITIILFSFYLTRYVICHMELASPLCRKSKYDKELQWFEIDYMNQFPLGNKDRLDFPFPCRGIPMGKIKSELKAGNNFTSLIAGDVPHNGGHCEWSISYDQKHFIVIHSIIGDCLTKGRRSYDIFLPNTLPNGRATLAWTWINRTGIREFYMNCADIYINSQNKSGFIVGPEIVVANLPNKPVIEQFNDGIKGEELYFNRQQYKTGLDDKLQPYIDNLY